MSFRIMGTGMYVPERVVTNDELSGLVDTNDEWIASRVGVRERRVAVGETCTDMACAAAKAALDDAGVGAGELDLILASSVSADYASPALACLVQKSLGATCPAYDVSAACSAFIFMLETAAGYFARGRAKKVLVVGAERLSGVLDWTDRSTCVIFGDGAGAAVLGECGEGDGGYVDSVINVKGGDDVISIPHFAGTSPFYERESGSPYIHMRGQETFMFAVGSITADISALLDREGMTIGDVAWFVPHQANRRIIDTAAKRLGAPLEKFYVNIERYGNTSSASVPIALDELNKAGLLHRGDNIVLSAFGAGLASAACLIKW